MGKMSTSMYHVVLILSPGVLIHSLANKVIHRTKSTNSSRPKTNQLPRKLPSNMLMISAKTEASPDQSHQQSISDIDGVTRVRSKTTALRLASLSLLTGIFLSLSTLFLGSFALETLGLGGGLYVLLEEFRVNGLDVR